MTAPARSDGTTTNNRAATQAKPTGKATTASRPSRASTDTTVEPPVRTTPAERPRRTRSAAAERAYARRAQREGRRDGAPRTRSEPQVRARVQPRVESRPRRQPVARKQTSTATFVVLVISLLLTGVAATLWLSTQAIADSYQLDDAKKGVAALSEQAEQLRRDVSSADSASELAKRAKELGMVPSGDPAYLVVGPDGKVRVVGDPTPATAPKPPPTSTSTPPPANTQNHQNTQNTAAQGTGQDHG